jgi:hypothetical protein
MRTLAVALAAAGLVLAVAPVRAQLPSAISQELFAFPGAHPSPGSAASAGLALADRWLGDEPFDNPAGARPYTLALSPLLLHVSRQDLRAEHRSYEETSAFFDAAGGYFTAQGGAIGLALYGHQPVLRLEDNAFLTGTLIGPAGSVKSNTDARELRGGLAVSFGRGRARLGIAGEFTHRADHYERTEDTGGPAPNTYVTDFSGDAVGGQAGLRVNLGEGPGAITFGAGLRYVPELELTGDLTLGGAGGSTTSPVSTRREAGWEGGLAARYVVTDAFHTLVSAGGKSAQSYEGWGVASGEGFEWKLAGEYHDQRDPWTLRFGFGQEQQTDVPEPRCGVIGLGFGFVFETTQIDLGVVHRTFKRGDHANSSEDRIVASLVQRF